ncbi:MAG: general secretion pathway protein G [Verrucomicrobiales bacterium]|jgi:general secretion pathway protein G
MKTTRVKPIVHRRTRGFTLMEMMMVLGIIALLLGVGVPMMVGVFTDAEKGKINADFRTISTNLIRYRTKTRSLPTTEQGLDALVNAPTLPPVPKNWERVSEPDGILDPWDRPYQYSYPGKNKTDGYDIFSMGKDGKPNTDDDIGNWQR